MNWSDYGARNYDAALGRWMNIDPLASKYYSISPYVYVANTPIKAIDPDGKQIIITGTKQERQIAFQNLQKLTNSKLKLKRNGRVKIKRRNARNKDKNLSVGTALVSRLVKSDKTIRIMSAEEFRVEKGNKGNPFAENSRAKHKGNVSFPEGDITTASNYNGTGTGANVVFDKDYEGNNIVNADGSTGREKHIGLAHELIHADRMSSGTMVEGREFSEQMIDPDNEQKHVLRAEPRQATFEELYGDN